MTEAYPLRWPDGWPRKKTGHMGARRFQVTPERAYRSLLEELKMLGARHVVVSTNLPLSRRDSAPLLSEDGKNMDWGVAVYFQLNGRQMVMAQDLYNRVYANMRSLALAVEAMRALERHGGGTMMQRAFDGFSALPPPEGVQAPERRPWRAVLDLDAEAFAALPKDQLLILAEAGYRKLAKSAHPDAGGSAERMAELNVAISAAREELQ